MFKYFQKSSKSLFHGSASFHIQQFKIKSLKSWKGRGNKVPSGLVTTTIFPKGRNVPSHLLSFSAWIKGKILLPKGTGIKENLFSNIIQIKTCVFLRVETMAELTAAAHQSWMDLQNDPIRLEKYMEMNRDWSMRNKFDLENKFDSLGRPLAHIEREAKKKQKEKQEENRNIEKTVEIGMKRGDLAKKKFYIAYFNTLCQTQEGFHIPCEAGM